MKSLPMEVMSSFNNQFMDFKSKDPAKVRSPAMFKFLVQYVYKLEKNYRSNPTLFNRNFSPMNVGIKPVWYGSPNTKPKPPCHPATAHVPTPRRPCTLCTAKGFQADHFPLNLSCGVAKLSSLTS